MRKYLHLHGVHATRRLSEKTTPNPAASSSCPPTSTVAQEIQRFHANDIFLLFKGHRASLALNS
jgi:hypothetical protein